LLQHQHQPTPTINFRKLRLLAYFSVCSFTAIARLADIIVIPSEANLTMLGSESIIEFYRTAEATGIINEELFRPEKWARDSVQLLCHSKEQGESVRGLLFHNQLVATS
jgi:hypothetical protein